jgi:hypothetical protein
MHSLVNSFLQPIMNPSKNSKKVYTMKSEVVRANEEQKEGVFKAHKILLEAMEMNDIGPKIGVAAMMVLITDAIKANSENKKHYLKIMHGMMDFYTEQVWKDE